MAPPLGIEPKPTVLETAVLPVTPGRYGSWAKAQEIGIAYGIRTRALCLKGKGPDH
jgi:hypothetical protein